MKISLSFILLSTAVMGTESPQGTPYSTPLSSATQYADLRQPLLTTIILTTLTAQEIDTLEDKSAKKKDSKQIEKKQKEKTYNIPKKNNSQKQSLSRYPGR